MTTHSTATPINQSAANALAVLDVIMRHMVQGLTVTEICQATELTAPSVSRYVSTLERTGWAERIPETGRIRASVRVGQRAMTILNELDKTQGRISELRNRLTTTF